MRFFEPVISRRQVPPQGQRGLRKATCIVEGLERRLQFSGAADVGILDPNGQTVAQGTTAPALPAVPGTPGAVAPPATFTLTTASATAVSLNLYGDTPDFTRVLTLDPVTSQFAAGDPATLTFTLNKTTPGTYTDLVILILDETNTGDLVEFSITETVLPSDLGVIGPSGGPPSQGIVSAAYSPDDSSNPHPSETSEFGRFELQGDANQVSLDVATTLNGTELSGHSVALDLAVQIYYAGNATQPDATLTPVPGSNLLLDTATGATMDPMTGELNSSAQGSEQLGPLPAGAYFITFDCANISPTFNGSVTETYNYTLLATALHPAISVLLGDQPVVSGVTTTDFGTVDQGDPTVIETYTIQNNGDGDLTLGSPAFSGSDFDVAQYPPAMIAPGQTAPFEIEFLTDTAGPKNEIVSIPTNDSAANPFTFTVSGTVIASQPVTALYDGTQQIATNQAQAIAFGTAVVGAMMPTQTFTLQNNGSTSLTVGAMNYPSGFTIVSPLPSVIAAGTAASFTLGMNTSSVGNPAGQVSFSTSDPNASSYVFTIAGTVSAPPILQVTAVTTSKIAATLIGGGKKAKGQVIVTLLNVSDAVLSGSVTVTVFASSSNSSVADGSQKLGVAVVKLKKLKVGKSQKVTTKVMFQPVSTDGTFFIVAQATGAGLTLPITGTAPNQVTILT